MTDFLLIIGWHSKAFHLLYTIVLHAVAAIICVIFNKSVINLKKTLLVETCQCPITNQKCCVMYKSK